MKRYLAAAFAVAVLLGSSGVAYASPYDWQTTYRNSDDTDYVHGGPGSLPDGNHAILGTTPDGGGSSEWYVLPSANCWHFTNGGGTYGSNNTIVSLDWGCVNVMDLTGTQDIVNSVSSLATAVASATSSVNSVSSTVSSLNSTVSGLSTSITANMQGTSTTLVYGQSGNTSAGLLDSARAVKLDAMPSYAARTMATSSRSIVTGTGATGFQVSSTRDANVNYSLTESVTASIGSASTVTVFLEIAPTNSATASDWFEVGRCTNGQTLTLAVALQSVQTVGCQVGGYVPAGYYAKLRSVTTGTGSATFNTGQEVKL